MSKLVRLTPGQIDLFKGAIYYSIQHFETMADDEKDLSKEDKASLKKYRKLQIDFAIKTKKR